MSLKDLFQNQSLSTFLPASSPEELSRDVESPDFIDAVLENKQKFKPSVDYSLPENFARFGLAEKYYQDSFTHIYSTYPYDGSKKEKVLWHVSASGLDEYLFENEYPRTNGYVTIGTNYGSIVAIDSNYAHYGDFEYIEVRGGPNTASSGMIGERLEDTFDLSNKWDEDNRRTNNLEINLDNGITIEFYLKHSGFTSGTQSPSQVIFDVSNGTLSGSSAGRLRLEMHPGVSGQEDKFYITMISGSDGLGTNVALGSGLPLLTSSWTHYAVSLKNDSSQVTAEVYVNAEKNDEITVGTDCGAVTGPMVATIGSLVQGASTTSARGWAKLSGSIDEFRFWKSRRTAEEIGRHWFTQVGAGTNTDVANTKLGIYYKFNEGIFDTGSYSGTDAVVLDYSGRFSNGYWTGYTLGARNTGSAMSNEFRDPIIYSTHPLVVEKLTELKDIGYIHDSNNSNTIYSSFATWIQDEDEKKDEPLKNIIQVLSFYFDDLFLQIKELPLLQDVRYIPTGSSVSPFVSRYLSGLGLEIPDILSQAEALEYFADRNNTAEFEKSFERTKNLIYQNIYNNIVFLNKNKGTYDGYRNIIRCFGIDESVLNIRSYSNNEKFYINDNKEYVAVDKKFLDFNNHDRFEGTIYQVTGSGLTSKSYIDKTGVPLWAGETYECEVVFPQKFKPNDELYFETGFLTSSILGIHEVPASDTDFTWSSPDRSNFLLQTIRTELEGEDVFFQLSSSAFTPLTTSVFPEVYTDTNWNFAIRLQKPGLHESAITGAWEIHFFGKQYYQDILQNQFHVSGTISDTFVSANKRLFVGSHRTNYTGSLLQRSDVKISNVRMWASELSDEAIDNHAKDITLFGGNNFSNGAILNPSALMNIPYASTLALNWSFDLVTSSDSSGMFEVVDVASGSSEYIDNSFLSSSVSVFYPGLGNFFSASDSEIISKEYVQTAKFIQPEQVLASDSVKVLSEDDERFTRKTRPIRTFFAIEKSPYTLISDQMIKFLGGIKDFNNLIGEPANRYRQEYKLLEKARNMFFSSIEEPTDVERFLEFWKWIDISIVKIIEQFIPASAILSNKIRTVIESHVFERNKIWNKFPTMEFKDPRIETGIKGIQELLYDYASGSAPVVLSQGTNALWWKQRAERSGSEAFLATGISGVDNTRQKILDVSLTALNRGFSTPLRLTGSQNGTYSGSVLNLFNQIPRVSNIRHDLANSSSNDLAYDQNPVENYIPLGGAYNKLGNYRVEYEVVNTSGRKTNNAWFTKNGGIDNGSSTSLYVEGVDDYLLPNRSIHKHVIVETFSAPGGPDVNARGARDIESEEYSAYNDINQRNKIVRIVLDTWSRTRNSKFGISTEQILGEDAPGYHKVHPNPVKRIINGATSSFNDNLFVSHAIPRSELQYSWISSSADNSVEQPYEYTMGFTKPQGTTGSLDAEAVVFLSASSTGDVFVQVNTQNGQIGWEVNNTEQLLSFGGTGDLNQLNNSRLGPWSWSSWKQLRVGDHQISRKLKKSNIFSIVQGIRDQIRQFFEPPVDYSHHPVEHVFLPKNSNSLVSFRHSWGNNKQGFANADLNIRSGYKNNDIQIYDKLKGLYLNTEFEDNNNPIDRFDNLTYTKTVYPRQEVVGLDKARNRQYYTEPSERTEAPSGGVTNYNIAIPDYTTETGIDRDWLNRRTFWRDGFEDRTRTLPIPLAGSGAFGGATSLLSSQGIKDGLSNSIFGFGILTNYTASYAQPYTGGLGGPIFGEKYIDSGELNAFRGNYRAYGLHGTYQLFSGRWGQEHEYFSRYPTASIGYTYSFFIPIVFDDLGGTYGAATTSGSYFLHPPKYQVHIEAGKNPFYDSYDEFIADIKPIAKEMSRIPEFIMDEHLGYYIDEKGGDFRAQNNSFLSDIGADISQSAVDEVSDPVETFFKNKVFSSVDDNRFILDSDHKKINGKIDSIKIKIEGIKKLLPYNGFYPSHRSLQLATLFSQSYAPFLKWNYDSEIPVFAENDTFITGALSRQALLDHYFNPGIVFNSIKSGIAVDAPCFTGSLRENIFGYYIDPPNFRLSFESAIDLKNGAPISSSARTSKVFSSYPYFNDSLSPRQSWFEWTGEQKNYYPLAASNFFAESVNFFLKDQKMKTIASTPEFSAKGQFISGNSYFLDVVLYKTKEYEVWRSSVPYSNPVDRRRDDGVGSFISYDGYSFGPPYLPFLYGGVGDVRQPGGHFEGDPAQAPVTPPYFYGKSRVRIQYMADGEENEGSLLSKIFAKSIMTHYNDELYEKVRIHNEYYDPTLRSDFPNDSDASASASPPWVGRMNLTASISIFGKNRLKSVDYTPTGTPEQVRSSEDTNNDVWVIQPKWECPNFNFTGSEQQQINMFLSRSFDTGDPQTWTFYPPAGLWSSYGQIPSNDEGIFFGIEESFNSADRGPDTGSLAEIFGFDTTPQRVGEIASSKEISEGVVVIPFVDKEIIGRTVPMFGKHVFKITRDIYELQKKNKALGKSAVTQENGFSEPNIPDTTISNLSQRIEKYVIPPMMDFSTYSDINPFVMYIFEFKHNLTKQDLGDIWQGLMPEISMNAEEESIEIAHRNEPWEFFEGQTIPSDIRYMTFKVKKKAEKNYYKITADSQDDDRFKFDFAVGEKEPEFSYNWPYDFFSLVEMAKVDVSYTLKPKPPTEQEQINRGIDSIRLETQQNNTGIIKKTNVLGKKIR